MLVEKYTACMVCGTKVTYKTNAKVLCADCRLARKREKAREAMALRRRKQGIVQVKGTLKPCENCGEIMQISGIRRKWCAPCAYQKQLEGARHHSRQVYVLPERKKIFDAWQAKNRKTPKGKIDNHMGTLVHRALRKNKGGRSWKTMVPYTWEELKAHLESQFQPGMSWGNHGEWHIDHIRPRASFAYTSPECPDFKECWALSNLQPLWANDNIRKSAKILEQTECPISLSSHLITASASGAETQSRMVGQSRPSSACSIAA